MLSTIIENCPNEIWFNFFSHLNTTDLNQLKSVDRHRHHLVFAYLFKQKDRHSLQQLHQFIQHARLFPHLHSIPLPLSTTDLKHRLNWINAQQLIAETAYLAQRLGVNMTLSDNEFKKIISIIANKIYNKKMLNNFIHRIEPFLNEKQVNRLYVSLSFFPSLDKKTNHFFIRMNEKTFNHITDNIFNKSRFDEQFNLDELNFLNLAIPRLCSAALLKTYTFAKENLLGVSSVHHAAKITLKHLSYYYPQDKLSELFDQEKIKMSMNVHFLTIIQIFSHRMSASDLDSVIESIQKSIRFSQNYGVKNAVDAYKTIFKNKFNALFHLTSKLNQTQLLSCSQLILDNITNKDFSCAAIEIAGTLKEIYCFMTSECQQQLLASLGEKIDENAHQINATPEEHHRTAITLELLHQFLALLKHQKKYFDFIVELFGYDKNIEKNVHTQRGKIELNIELDTRARHDLELVIPLIPNITSDEILISAYHKIAGMISTEKNTIALQKKALHSIVSHLTDAQLTRKYLNNLISCSHFPDDLAKKELTHLSTDDINEIVKETYSRKMDARRLVLLQDYVSAKDCEELLSLFFYFVDCTRSKETLESFFQLHEEWADVLTLCMRKIDVNLDKVKSIYINWALASFESPTLFLVLDRMKHLLSCSDVMQLVIGLLSISPDRTVEAISWVHHSLFPLFSEEDRTYFDTELISQFQSNIKILMYKLELLQLFFQMAPQTAKETLSSLVLSDMDFNFWPYFQPPLHALFWLTINQHCDAEDISKLQKTFRINDELDLMILNKIIEAAVNINHQLKETAEAEKKNAEARQNNSMFTTASLTTTSTVNQPSSQQNRN